VARTQSVCSSEAEQRIDALVLTSGRGHQKTISIRHVLSMALSCAFQADYSHSQIVGTILCIYYGLHRQKGVIMSRFIAFITLESSHLIFA
jgi:hypothetical protein